VAQWGSELEKWGRSRPKTGKSEKRLFSKTEKKCEKLRDIAEFKEKVAISVQKKGLFKTNQKNSCHRGYFNV